MFYRLNLLSRILLTALLKFFFVSCVVLGSVAFTSVGFTHSDAKMRECPSCLFLVCSHVCLSFDAFDAAVISDKRTRVKKASVRANSVILSFAL